MTTGELLDQSEFERWLDEARLALRAARTQTEAGIHNWACFLAEQAAQLAVKGLLHAAGRGPWGHDLVRLGAEAAKICEGWGEMEPRLLRLSRHYIPARYPDAHAGGSSASHYGPEDSAQALDDAAAIQRAVEGCWDLRSGRLEDDDA